MSYYSCYECSVVALELPWDFSYKRCFVNMKWLLWLESWFSLYCTSNSTCGHCQAHLLHDQMGRYIKDDQIKWQAYWTVMSSDTVALFWYACLPNFSNHYIMSCYKWSVVDIGGGEVLWHLLWRSVQMSSSFVMSWYELLQLLWVFSCGVRVAMSFFFAIMVIYMTSELLI
jgi:hypothetical protein